MSGGRGQPARQAMLARLARYAELRDGGTRPYEAAAELGVHPETGSRYERWYRQQSGQPPRQPGFRDSGWQGHGPVQGGWQ